MKTAIKYLFRRRKRNAARFSKKGLEGRCNHSMFRVPSVEGSRETGVREMLRRSVWCSFNGIFFGQFSEKSSKKDLRRWSRFAPSPIPSIESSGKEVGTINEGGEGLVLSANFRISKNIRKRY